MRGRRCRGCHGSDVSAIRNCVSGDRTTNFLEDFIHSEQELHLLSTQPSSLSFTVSTAERGPFSRGGKIPLTQIQVVRIEIRHGFKSPTKRGPVGLSLPTGTPIFLGSSLGILCLFVPWRPPCALDHREPSSWNSSSQFSPRV